MATNVTPIFTKTPHTGWGTTALATANTAVDGTGTQLAVFTAGANGSFCQRIRFRPAGTNIATVARVFINNGASSATPANNILWDEITLSATTASSVAALATYELPMNFPIAAGYVINVTTATTVAAGYYVSLIGGDY